jgi:hypothetical protein
MVGHVVMVAAVKYYSSSQGIVSLVDLSSGPLGRIFGLLMVSLSRSL